METFSVLLALGAGNSPVTGELPSQKTVTRSFDVFSDLRLNKQLSKQKVVQNKFSFIISKMYIRDLSKIGFIRRNLNTVSLRKKETLEM